MHHRIFFTIFFNHQKFFLKKTHFLCRSALSSFNGLFEKYRNCDGKNFPLCHFACYISFFCCYMNKCLAFQVLLSKIDVNSLLIIFVLRNKFKYWLLVIENWFCKKKKVAQNTISWNKVLLPRSTCSFFKWRDVID